MLNILFPLLVISSGSLLGSIKDRKYEEVLPITIMAIILIEYIFYIFNILKVGLYLTWLIAFIIYIYFIYHIIKYKSKRQSIRKNLLTPGFLVFILSYFIIFFLTNNSEVLLWDELRLWGAYPKILYYSDTLQLGANSQVMDIMQSYNPGMPLFQYFFLKTAGIFKESYLYLAYSLLGLSLLLPITKKLTWKKLAIVPIIIFCLIFIPLICANSYHDSMIYYLTLFIEPILGITFGVALYFTTQNILSKKSDYLLFLLTLGTLTLLKDTGILFASTAYISFFLNEMLIHKEYKKNKQRTLLKLLLPILLMISIFISWKLVQNIYNTDNMYTDAMDKTSIISVLTNPTENEKNIINTFKEETFNRPLLNSNFTDIGNYTNFINLIILSIIILSIYIIINKNRKPLIISAIVFYSGSLIYYLGTFVVYLISIKTVASFPRYMSVIFTAYTIFMFLLIVNELLSNKKDHKIISFTMISIVLVIMLFPFQFSKTLKNNYLYQVNEISEQYSNNIKEHLQAKEKIALVFTKDYKDNFAYIIYQHQIYMDLIDEGFTFLDCLFLDEDIYEKLEDYNYAYVIKINDSDTKVFNSILNEPITDSSLFRIVDKAEIKLDKI